MHMNSKGLPKEGGVGLPLDAFCVSLVLLTRAYNALLLIELGVLCIITPIISLPIVIKAQFGGILCKYTYNYIRSTTILHLKILDRILVFSSCPKYYIFHSAFQIKNVKALYIIAHYKAHPH